jgi:hypothetical protein
VTLRNRTRTAPTGVAADESIAPRDGRLTSVPDSRLERLRPRTTLQRAVYPVVGGLLFFTLLGLTTWGIAAIVSRNPENVEERLASPTLEVGRAEAISATIADGGPVLFPGLIGTGDRRSVVLDHTGEDPKRGWRVYYAFPADRTRECAVTQVRGTRDFVDCDGRTVPVEQLAPPPGVRVLVSDVIVLDLRAAQAEAAASTTTTTG